VHKAFATDLIPIPKTGTHLLTFGFGKRVIAMFPDTTTFYPAHVRSFRRDTYSLWFEGEENGDIERAADKRYVLGHSNVFGVRGKVIPPTTSMHNLTSLKEHPANVESNAASSPTVSLRSYENMRRPTYELIDEAVRPVEPQPTSTTDQVAPPAASVESMLLHGRVKALSVFELN
jgi:SGF29 tudor-like domain